MLTDKIASIRKWLKNYWYYYRIHVFAAIFVLIVTVITIVECVNKVEPDADITYFGSQYFSDEFSEEFKLKISAFTDDINKDGKQIVYFTPLNFGGEVKSEQDVAMVQKAQLVIAAGDSYLYLMDKNIFEQYYEQELFADISQYVGESQPTYSITASHSKILNDLGLKNSEQIRIALRVLNIGDQNKPDRVALYNNAAKILTELAKKD